jgi:hypothetical protein
MDKVQKHNSLITRSNVTVPQEPLSYLLTENVNIARNVVTSTGNSY